MPFSGKRPIIAPIFMIVCVLSQAKTPITNNLENVSFVQIMIRRILANKIAYRPIMAVEPMKPNFSASMANIESFSASGKYPYACTPLPKPRPKIPPLPTAINAWQD